MRSDSSIAHHGPPAHRLPYCVAHQRLYCTVWLTSSPTHHFSSSPIADQFTDSSMASMAHRLTNSNMVYAAPGGKNNKEDDDRADNGGKRDDKWADDSNKKNN